MGKSIANNKTSGRIAFIVAVAVLGLAAVGLNGATEFLKLYFKKLPVSLSMPLKEVPAVKLLEFARPAVPWKTRASPGTGAVSRSQFAGVCQLVSPSPSQDLVAAGAVTMVKDAAADKRAARRVNAWGWLMEQDRETVLSLLAFCTAQTVNAVRHPHNTAVDERLVASNDLAESLGLDMAKWWAPTAETYLGSVPKDAIVDAVREGVSPEAADNLASLKKAALVAEAELRLAGRFRS